MKEIHKRICYIVIFIIIFFSGSCLEDVWEDSVLENTCTKTYAHHMVLDENHELEAEFAIQQIPFANQRIRNSSGKFRNKILITLLALCVAFSNLLQIQWWNQIADCYEFSCQRMILGYIHRQDGKK